MVEVVCPILRVVCRSEFGGLQGTRATTLWAAGSWAQLAGFKLSSVDVD